MKLTEEKSFKPESPTNPPPRFLLISRLLPFIAGGVYGLLVRVIFSGHRVHGISGSDVMTVSFAFFAPFAIGAITVYLAERVKQRGISYYVFAPWLSVGFIFGTAITLYEGSICIVLALPLFLAAGSLGGLLMGMVCRLTHYPKRTVHGIAVLPVLLVIGEMQQPLENTVDVINQRIHIQAPAAVVWQHINFPTNIQPEELADGLAYKIGVPFPIEARTLSPKVGGKRALTWQRGIHFEEVIEAYQENKFIQWRYIFSEDSFPVGSMDEHVKIGGRYFNLENTSYHLDEDNAGTWLEISVQYRVSTGFNWYAEPWVHFLIQDTANAILKFYKQRSEATG